MIILDTNVISELMRPKPSPRVAEWVATQAATELATTSITEAEVLYGIAVLNKGMRREQIHAAAEAMFTEDFAGRIFAFDSDAARNFAGIAAGRRSRGRPISHPDAQIAAIAKTLGAKLATRNVSDFEGCGLDVIDPWSGA